MKKEDIIIGALILGFGYLALKIAIRIKQRKGFPFRIDIAKIKETIQSSDNGMMVVTKKYIYDNKYEYSKNSNGEVDLWDKETNIHGLYDSNGILKSIYDPSKVVMTANAIGSVSQIPNAPNSGYYSGVATGVVNNGSYECPDIFKNINGKFLKIGVDANGLPIYFNSLDNWYYYFVKGIANTKTGKYPYCAIYKTNANPLISTKK